jgi:protein-tyrosine phosphatase
MRAVLPAPRTAGRYSIGLVCLGNICRSPMADVVLTEQVDEAGLSGRVAIVSSGTRDWHVGNPMDERAAATLLAADYDPTLHRARQWASTWLDDNDLVLAMDGSNLADIGGATERVRLFRDFDPVDPGGEVPDPYYGGDDGFEEVLTMVERTCATIVAALQLELREEILEESEQP